MIIRDDVISDVIRPVPTIREDHIDTPGEHCVKVSSNSAKNCRRRIILKKRDVTIMTSYGHVTSSEACAIDSAYKSSYWLYIETIPLSGLVSEIFSPKFATMVLRDDVISDAIRPSSTIRDDHIDLPYRGTLC